MTCMCIKYLQETSKKILANPIGLDEKQLTVDEDQEQILVRLASLHSFGMHSMHLTLQVKKKEAKLPGEPK